MGMVKYCRVSRENALRFHEDALRDLKGLTELHQKSCDVMGIENETAATSAQRIKDGLRSSNEQVCGSVTELQRAKRGSDPNKPALRLNSTSRRMDAKAPPRGEGFLSRESAPVF
jgi:hypothetical protein